jgi:phage terminase large subunit-like protein
MTLRPWQRYVLDRALEVREDGELRWSTVVLSVARQQGKSVLLRGVAWWRMHAADRFGEAQTVLHVANRANTAREAWEPAARLAEVLWPADKGARYRSTDALEIRYTAGRESLRIPNGSRWLVQAANQNAGVGFSVSAAIVDEAWNVKRDVVEVAISPTMSARNQPQLWLVSTAGDSGSDLLRSYRDLATADPGGDVLLLEWSAPPEAPYGDVGTWRWASPEWDDRRATFLRSRVAAMPSAAFRSQYCNQWTVALDGWMPAEVWRGCAVTRLAGPRRKDAPVVAVETSPEDQRVTVVAAWRRGEKVAVWSHLARDLDAAWAWARSVGAARLLLPPDLAVHYPGDGRLVGVVGSRELRTLLPGVDRAVRDRRVVYRAGDEYLTSHVLSAVAVSNHDGTRSLSTKRSPGPIAGARCMVWAVGEVLRPASPRPVIVTA